MNLLSNTTEYRVIRRNIHTNLKRLPASEVILVGDALVFVEVVQLFSGRGTKRRMLRQVRIEPTRSRLLGAYADQMRWTTRLPTDHYIPYCPSRGGDQREQAHLQYILLLQRCFIRGTASSRLHAIEAPAYLMLGLLA